jgi:hypothetical protein
MERHFIEQLTLASWLSSPPTTARIWTGMWTTDTLRALLPPDFKMEAPMSISDRHKFRRITRLLTQPLITAYKQMIRVGTHSPLPTTAPLLRPPIFNTIHHRTSLLIHQSSQTVTTSILESLYTSRNTSQTIYSYSDAAFQLTDEDIGTRLHIT